MRISEALKKVVRPKARLVVVHSNLGALGVPEDPLGEVMAAFESALPRGCTVAVPTFTFSFCKTGRFDISRSPGEVGLLGEAFRKMPGVRRTHHPIYSFAVKGPLADELVPFRGTTCWGQGSVFDRMVGLDADLVMLGCGWEFCTLFHRCEELEKVPYREFKDFHGVADFGQGPRSLAVSMYVRRQGFPVVNRFEAIPALLRRQRRLRAAEAGRALLEGAGAADILKAGCSVLKDDSLALLTDPDSFRRSQIQWRVALLSSANLELFSDTFKREAFSWIKEGCRVFVPPFCQFSQQILADGSALRAFDPEWTIFMERAEDVLGNLLSDPLSGPRSTDEWLAAVRKRVDDYLALLRQARQRLKGKILVLDFDQPASSPLGLSDGESSRGQAAAVREANAALRKGVRSVSDCHCVPFSAVSAAVGRAASEDEKYWYLARAPFHRALSTELSRRLIGAMLSLKGRTARALVLDLDNTLWKGIVGEDGLEGIQLGGDFPGNAFKDFQRSIAALRRRGIILALCSKNSEAVAMAAIEKHPEMILRSPDFAAKRINWDDKASNIAAIAEELSLGLGSLCFIDDDPRERELVRKQLPEVFVPDLPRDPVLFPAFIRGLPCLESLQLTGEDLQRAASYQRRAEIGSKAGSSPESLAEFLKSLGMILTIERFGPGNEARSLQLLAKTNQFNTTTRRYTQAELSRLVGEGAAVYPIGLADRFAEKEIIGLIIVRWDRGGRLPPEIDSFLLSCRVLGRGVETGVLAWAAMKARGKGFKSIEAPFIPTSRNQPAARVFQEHGFVLNKKGLWELPLSQGRPVAPEWLEVKEA